MSKEIEKIYTVEELKKYLKKSILLASEKVEEPPVIMKIDDSIICTLGNFSAIIGKAKSRKTFNVSAMVAAALSNTKILQYVGCLPKNKKVVLYIDTEQGRYHCLRVLKRIIDLCNLEEQPENFIFLTLRDYNPNQRMQMIDLALKEYSNIGLVIIDGVRDLVFDINSPHEATIAVTKLMQWTSYYQLHILTVIHQNKVDTNTRGHLGTEINNKSESVLSVTKSETNKEISIVESDILRDRDFERFAFNIVDGLPELTEITESETKLKKSETNPEDQSQAKHIEILKKIFNGTDSYTYENLRLKIQETIKMGIAKAKNYITYWRDNNFVFQEGKQYFYNDKLLPF